MEMIRRVLLSLGLLLPLSAHAAPNEEPALPTATVTAITVTPLAPPPGMVGPGPLAVDLHAGGWPGRALDPVLTVGEHRFTVYTHPAPGVIRFSVEDGSLLVPGAAAWLQYGDDARSRVDLTALLAEAQR